MREGKGGWRLGQEPNLNEGHKEAWRATAGLGADHIEADSCLWAVALQLRVGAAEVEDIYNPVVLCQNLTKRPKPHQNGRVLLALDAAVVQRLHAVVVMAHLQLNLLLAPVE